MPPAALLPRVTSTAVRLEGVGADLMGEDAGVERRRVLHHFPERAVAVDTVDEQFSP
jgi:hypothetical protein